MRIINKKDNKALIYYNNEFYVISESVVPFTGLETLIFKSDAQGTITDWIEVGGGKGLTLNEVIKDRDTYMTRRWG